MCLLLFSAIFVLYYCFFVSLVCFLILSLGSFSNDDGDGNENVKKAMGLDWQNNNFARASRFFVHFYAVAARLERESAHTLLRFSVIPSSETLKRFIVVHRLYGN